MERNMIDFILKNKEWIFSGIGVAIIGALVSMVFRGSEADLNQNQTGNNNIQAGGNVAINSIEHPESLGVILSVVNSNVIVDEETGRIANTLDIKLKNSGDESAFIHGIQFLFDPPLISTSTCGHFEGHKYNYDLNAILIGSKSELKNIPSSFRLSENDDFGPVLNISQEVPAKGVDRIKIKFHGRTPPCVHYLFNGKAVLLYDDSRRLSIDEFGVHI